MSDSTHETGASDSAILATEQPLSPEIADIFVANHREFLAFLERRVGSRAIAEDILQEAFVKGMNRIDASKTEKGEGSIVAWFYRTLRNAAIDYHRRHQTASKALASFAAENDAQPKPDPDLHAAVCQCVNRLAATLKPEFATALRRIEVDGVAVKDYAVEAGISSSNAAVRVFRAREALRKQVARSCGTCAEHGCLECTCEMSGGGCAPGLAPGGHTHHEG
jgi:RNA polymerase sigma factor (sigma-70 family)